MSERPNGAPGHACGLERPLSRGATPWPLACTARPPHRDGDARGRRHLTPRACRVPPSQLRDAESSAPGRSNPHRRAHSSRLAHHSHRSAGGHRLAAHRASRVRSDSPRGNAPTRPTAVAAAYPTSRAPRLPPHARRDHAARASTALARASMPTLTRPQCDAATWKAGTAVLDTAAWWCPAAPRLINGFEEEEE
jgi:hypothetical protein